METRQLVEMAKEGGHFATLTSLAKAVGVNHSSLSLLASGKGELSDETYVKLAELAGLDPAEVIIEKHARKAGAESRKVWERLRHALAKYGSVLVVCLIPASNLHNINALEAHVYTKHNPHTRYYATLIRRA
ncbi:MAG: hypothetical protein JJ714_03185 [Acidithiobacillus sp.]|nr:hypothetical protein [Acidithiobacillus sp.]